MPSPRYNASMCANLNETCLYIYGGRDSAGRCYNDFYRYDIEENFM